MEVKLEVASTEDINLYRNLLNIMQNDLSTYSEILLEVDADGYFDKNSVLVYFDNEKVIPYKIIYDNRVIGIIVFSKEPFVKEGCDYCIQEMFVLNYYRGKGIAVKAIEELFSLHKGKYCLSYFDENVRAASFWKKVVQGKNAVIRKQDELMSIIEFEVK